MFLTFISIVMIAALMLVFTPTDINLRSDISVAKARVSSMNDYVLDLENVYLERTLHATGIKTIIALIRYMEEETINNGAEEFLTDFEAAFTEVLLDGTYLGVDIDTYYPETVMTGNTYNDWLDRIKTTGENTFNVDTAFGINKIEVYQIDPWFVNVDANITFNVSSETASWNKTALIKTEIEIENFNDPYYLVNTAGDYVNKIRRTGTLPTEWIEDKVIDFIADGNYTYYSNAPSFIMRFINDMSPSDCCGIESLVDPGVVSEKDVSYVDYKYWADTSECSPTSHVLYNFPPTIDNRFKLDPNHRSFYNLPSDSQICGP